MTQPAKIHTVYPGTELAGGSAQAGAAADGAVIGPGELRGVFLRSLGWTGAARLAAALGGSLRYLVFARLLSPFDFGVFGAASVAELLVREFTDPNFSRALVPRKEKINQYLDTVWSVAVAQGVLIAIVMVAAARPLARFFQIDHLGSAFVAIAPFPIVTGMASPAVAARIYRDLDFRVSLILNVAELAGGFQLRARRNIVLARLARAHGRHLCGAANPYRVILLLLSLPPALCVRFRAREESVQVWRMDHGAPNG